MSNNITDVKELYEDHTLKNGGRLGIVRFADMRQCLEIINKRFKSGSRGDAIWDNLFCVESDNHDYWRYGKEFPSREDTCDALKVGKISQKVIREYERQRKLVERKVGIDRFIGKGLSCKRKRKASDIGDELSLSRIMSGTDKYWMRTERHNNRKNIRIGVNYSLSHVNGTKDYARLGGTLALLSDMCYKLGYSVEIHGLGVSGYHGSEDYKYIISDTIIKKPQERMDIQRVLSIMHQGFHRDVWFGLKDKLFNINRSSYGHQAVTNEEMKQIIGCDYIIEQSKINTDKNLGDFIQSSINKLSKQQAYLGSA
jgi:hypothetical protein